MTDPVQRILDALPVRRRASTRRVCSTIADKRKTCHCGREFGPSPGESKGHWISRESCSPKCGRVASKLGYRTGTAARRPGGTWL